MSKIRKIRITQVYGSLKLRKENGKFRKKKNAYKRDTKSQPLMCVKKKKKEKKEKKKITKKEEKKKKKCKKKKKKKEKNKNTIQTHQTDKMKNTHHQKKK